MTQKAVPVEPTNEMIHAGMAAYHDFGTPMTRYANIYKAMLAAAPVADGRADVLEEAAKICDETAKRSERELYGATYCAAAIRAAKGE